MFMIRKGLKICSGTINHFFCQKDAFLICAAISPAVIPCFPCSAAARSPALPCRQTAATAAAKPSDHSASVNNTLRDPDKKGDPSEGYKSDPSEGVKGDLSEESAAVLFLKSRARKAAVMPVSTSPLPAAAIPLLPVVLRYCLQTGSTPH